MLKRKDQAMLSEAYESVGIGGISAPNLMGKPVMITMDMPGAEVSTEDDSNESDQEEVEMAVSDLRKLSKLAHKLLHMIEDEQALEGWVAAKITKASDYISSVYDSMSGEDDEGCGCSDDDEDDDMFDKGYEDADECSYAAAGCKCGGCSDCQ